MAFGTPSHESVSSEDLARSVDALMFAIPQYWLDGNVFRLVAALNAFGIRTFMSCEGSNPLHRNIDNTRDMSRISMPAISLLSPDAANHPRDPMNRALGASRLQTSHGEALEALMREFYSERAPGKFPLQVDATRESIGPSILTKPQRVLTFEDHEQGVAELNGFAEWIVARYFQKGTNMDEAIRINAGGTSSHTIDQLPDYMNQRGIINVIATEYSEKGLPVTISGVVSKLIQKTLR